MKKSLLLASLASLSLPAYAQNPANFQKPQQSNQSSGDTHTNSRRQPAESPFGKEIPLFDPSDESFTFGGKKMSLKDSRFAGQFEAFLVMDQSKIEDAAKYRAILKKIITTLDRTTPGSPSQKQKEAYKLLSAASEYPADAKICESLQNAIMLAKLSMNKGKQNDKIIADLKKHNQRLVNNMDFMETRTRLDMKPGKGKTTAEKQAENRTSSKYLDKRREQLENMAKMKKADLESGVAARLAKIQYQAFLMQLFAQRRFEHVIIGCRYYNLIFGGESKLRVKKNSDLDKLFSDSFGVNPTVAGLDSASNDFIGKATTLSSAVRNHLRRNQVEAATQRMIEAFTIGEHLTPIHTFEPKYRDQISNYIQDSKQLKDAATVKNWQEAEIYTDKLKKQSRDFRYIAVTTAINGFKKGSNMHLSMQRIAAGKGDADTAQYHFNEAVKMWPTNPKIDRSIDEIDNKIKEAMNNQKTLANTTREFENLVRHNDYRNLTVKDAARYQETFKTAMNHADISKADADTYRKHYDKATELYDGTLAIETAIKEAEGWTKESQHYAAWEVLMLEKKKKHLDYSRINEKLADSAHRASRFKKLFDDATEHMEKRNYGSALSFYLKAKTLHPKSKLAQQGIDEVLAARTEQ